jgi:hypothetical protein
MSCSRRSHYAVILAKERHVRHAIHIAPLIAAVLIVGILSSWAHGQGTLPAGSQEVALRDSARIKEALGRLLDDSYQTMPPDGKLAEHMFEMPRIRVPALVFALLRLLIYALIGVALVLGGFWVYNAFMVPERRKREEASGEIPGESGGRLRLNSFSRAQQLVAEKRFAEAIHALLLAAIEWLNRAGDKELPDSLTSREVLRGSGLTGGPELALSRLVAAVELVHFGGVGAVHEDYEECLKWYHRLLETDPEDDR